MPLSKESCMQMAISVYKKQKIKSKLQATGVFKVFCTTLHTYLKGRKPCSETYTNSYKLIISKEEALIKKLPDTDK
jgi:hypothetical protein